MMVIWGLSQAQAAATLVIILIGIDAHIFPEYFGEFYITLTEIGRDGRI